MTIPGWSTTRQLFSWIVLLSILSCARSQEDPDPSTDSQEPVIGSIRLRNGTESSGRLEIFYEGEWGTICNDGWGKYEADVACKSLGFGNGIPQNVSAGSGKIFLAEVRCKGDEKSVVECSNNKFEPHECTHDMDAGVICDAAVTSEAQINNNYVSNCNFEYGTCGFRITSSSSYQWQRRSGSTPSSSTGPSGDHTYGSGYGYYMYTEASSGYSGSISELTNTMRSQWVQGLSFWYHMYGQTIGTLDVILNTRSGKKVIWTKSGAQGNYWQHACIMVNDYLNGLTFRGRRGSSYTGDIAIDDISFITGSCTSNENGTCTFQNGICGYQTIPGNNSNTNWNVITGGSYRAPIYDHSIKKSTGRYLSLNSRYGTEGMRNYFLSPPITIDEKMKVEFYYFISGSVPGELQVSFRDLKNPMDSWNKGDWQDFGDHGVRWNYGCMDLHLDPKENVTTKRILFTGITGATNLITLALDDITTTKGSCGIGIDSHQCTFDNPKLCNYQINCTAHQEYTWRRTKGRTSSYSTGPSNDGDLKSSGYYLYAEGSYGKAGDAVSVIFPVKNSMGKVLKFKYHMYGQNMGALLLRYSTGKSMKDVWSISGNQGNIWNSFCMKLNEEIDSVVFIAVRGYKFTSDIALDNIFLDTSCPNAVNCDFENGMCNYTMIRNPFYSSYRWYRTMGSDHTHGNGYYAYVRTNYGEGLSTHMITTNIKQTSNTSSLQFHYKVYSTETSKLMVQLNSLTPYTQTDLMEPKYFKMDEDGWIMGCMDIPANTVVRANFTVISGVDRSGTIMLDDIYYNGFPCVVGIVNNVCKFDEPNVCGYNVSCRQATQYMWKRGSRSTRSPSTGPNRDNSNGGNGYYMYTESSFGSPGDITDLEFPSFVPADGHYLSFYYNMNGRDIGSLQVSIITRFGKTLEWMETGHLGSNWMKGCVNLQKNETTTVVFTGVRGNGPLGDIAIDDVTVESGICYRQSIACDFQDEMMCGYRNISSSSYMGWVRRSNFPGYYITTTSQHGNHRLRSPLKNITDSCIQISYEITGQSCSLDVYTTHNNQKRLSLHALNSTRWNLAQFHIDQAMTHLLLDAKIIYNWYHPCSIKINTIKIMNGTCPELVCQDNNSTRCADQTQCINNALLCDRQDHCLDKSDENNCTKSISCDFEDKYLCGYQFKYGWYHTNMKMFGNPDLYLNNSDYAMTLNSGRSVLTSPEKEIKESCLKFYYVGGTGSRLDVRAIYNNGTNSGVMYTNMTNSSIWSLEFIELTKWTIGQFNLPAGHVSIEFIGRASTLGLAIDNVELREGKCGEIVCSNDTFACKSNEKCYSSTNLCNRNNECDDNSDEFNCPASLSCDVEHPYQCGYQYTPGTWSVQTGRSMVYPDLDHSLGLYSGHYFVSNFSYAPQSNYLMAPEEKISVNSCLTFYYSFYGMGDFEIYDNGLSRLKIKPNHINTWQKSQLQLSPGNHNITFAHKIFSNGSQYDVLALDSISVSSGQCDVFECEDGWRKCSYSSVCVPKSKFCDREMDCSSGEDEYNCTTYSNVRLVGGRNVHQGYVQIFYRGTWEFICGFWPTTNARITCKEMGYNGTSRATFKTKISTNTNSGITRLSCRGYESNLEQCQISRCYYSYCTCSSPAAVDCSDTECPSTHVPCPAYNETVRNSSSTSCIPKESMCDGEKDCPGGTDEKSCPKCKSNQFQCLNYDCIPDDQRCDGKKDCSDESDEYHCFKHDGVTLSFMMFGKYVPVCEDNLKDQNLANQLCHFVGKGNASVGLSTATVTGAKFVYTTKLNHSILPDYKPILGSCRPLSLKCNQRECGSRSSNLYDPLIQHGHKALAGEFPWQASLHYGSRFTCGAILIDDEHVLTAAHCVRSGGPSSYSVNLGSTLRYGGQKIRVSKIMAHRNFTMSLLRNDIAVLKLSTPVKMTDYIRPACLPSKPWKPHTQCFATGWGRIEDLTSPNDLMETKVYILPRKTCTETYKYSDDTTVCANHKEPNQPGCYGDSGGPMVCRNEQGYWEVIGVFSYGKVQCAGHNSSPQVFADVYTFRDWILNRI